MPYFIAALIGGLSSAVGTLTGKVLLALGISAVTYTGISSSITWATGYLVNSVQALPPNAVAIAGTMKLGVCISILTSALVVRLTLAGLTSGAISRWVKT